ncbi:MAG: putative AAA+ superfamily ATPase [Candidatus Omnitrophota bacterium]|jgi:predicted AAA+ superfamily ATPase
MISRSIHLPVNPDNSFFLWGPRQSGKTMLLKATYPKAIWYDLLLTDLFIELTQNPSLLRQQLIQNKSSSIVVIDEIQKIPLLLDEVHWLIENTNHVFALCGSSARKVKRGHANLLGGRALRYELHGLVSRELKADFDLIKIINRGYLPRHYLSSKYEQMLRSYVHDYLKEEIASEALVRNLPAFSNFLQSASLSDTELINYSTIARDCGVSSQAIKEYYQILFDTMLASPLEAYKKRPKRRVIGKPKLYFFDIGVVNHLAKRGKLEPGSELFGKAFENWVHHELNTYRVYSNQYYDMSYWRLASGIEVDFIINNMDIAIEAKATKRITQDHLKGLRELKKDHPNVKRSIIVCLENIARQTNDGIEIIPYQQFCQSLWSKQLIS